MKNSLIKKKYRSLLIAGMVAMLVEYIVLLSDNIIVGQLIGESGLAATTLVMPFFMLIVFFNMLFVTGTSVGMSTEIGRMNAARANELFSNGTLLSLLVGAAVSVAAVFAKPLFLHTDQVSGEVYALASSYYNGLIPLPFVMIVNNVLYECITNVGNEDLCLISSIVQVVTNIGLSIALGLAMGIHGVALGTTISTLLALLVLLVQFLRADNTLKLVWRLSLRDFVQCCKFGFFDASKYLYDTVFMLIMNAFILSRLGEDWLPVFCTVTSAQSLMVAALDGTGNALQPLVSIYEGENNMGGMRRAVVLAEKSACYIGVFLSVLMIVCARPLTQILGITDPVTVERSVLAIRIVSASSLFVGVLTTISSYYLCRGKIVLASLCAMAQSLMQLILALVVWLIFGANGIWLGIALAPLAAIAATAFILLRRYGKNRFPFLQDREDVQAWACFDGLSRAEDVMKIVYDAEAFMTKQNVDSKIRLRAMLLIEETCMSVAEMNGDKPARIECCVHTGREELHVILRDDGKRADVTNDDRELGSMQSYLSSRIISNYRQKSYLQATGFNRSVFTIPLTQGQPVSADA